MNTFKRTICLLLTLALMLGLMPNVFAAQPTFIDVPAGMYYSAPVAWAVENGITNGTGGNTFSPDRICSRGQVVTFLWRAQGSPEPASTVNRFTDAVPGSYYYKAMLWAVEQGITTGTGSGTTFSPDMNCNRDQVVTFLWRAQGKPTPVSSANPFTDVPAGSYYYDAVLWAVEQGITTGTGTGTTFSPGMSCSRGQIVTFLQRAIAPEKPIDPPVDDSLHIVMQPQSATIEEDESAILRVVVTGGTAPYTYQWKKNGSNIVGANSDSYTASVAGSYTCTISDADGNSITTSKATITISKQTPLTIMQQPQNATIEEGENTILRVVVSGGTTPYTYQWKKNGNNIVGANADSYTASVAGNYTCTISDAKGSSVITSEATVAIRTQAPLVILQQPQAATIESGNKVALTVSVSGGKLPYHYQWSVNGLAIDGATSASYTTGEAGNYICTVTDDANNSVTTNTAVVSVYGSSDQPYEINYQLTYYNVNKGDQYIAKQYIDNSENPKFFGPTDSFELKNVECPGYEFLGWYTSGGTHVAEIEAGTTQNLTLYARWAENNYTITYNLYQTPVTSVPTAEQKSYTVSKGNYNLYNPEINNYIFLGWYDKNGVEYKTIPIGTTGNIVLNAYYTSRRNLAVSKVDNNPIIVEDRNNNVVYFTYEIGEIRNVPLTPDKPFWRIESVAGLSEQKSTEYTVTTSETAANSISQTVLDMTVNSNTWTLEETWTDVITVNETWAQSLGKTAEQCKTEATTASNTLSVSDQMGGSSYHKTEDGSTVYDYDSKTETNDKGHQFDANVSGSYANKLSANIGASNEYGTENSYNEDYAYTNQGKINAGNWSSSDSSSGAASVSDKDKYSAGISYENGFEINAGLHYGYHNNTNTVTKTGSDTVTVNSEIDENTSSWNSSSSYATTNQHSTSQSVRNTLSDIVTTTKGYGESYSNGGRDSSTQGFSSTSSNTSGTTSTVTYSKLESTKTTTTYSVNGMIEGKYRCILAGKAHVFAVVGYDYNTKSYFTYTFSVMDDATEEFLDYTPKGGDFDDCENSCLPFEIPIDVYEYVNNRTVKTSGIAYRANSSDGTATITKYTGTSADVVIPSYVSDGRQAYKVISISSAAFAGKDVRTVVLGEFIKSIPEGAFKNCKSLEAIIGSFTEIEYEAFAGCTKLTNMGIPSNVVKIGKNAFNGVESINVRAINSLSAYAEAAKALPQATDSEIEKKQREITQEFIDSVLQSGAQNIVLDLSEIKEGMQLTIEVPAINSIKINGGVKTYDNFILKSSADSTILNEITIRNTNAVPLTVDSDKLTLDKVFVNGKATALVLKKDGSVLSLNHDSALESSSQYTVVSKNPTIEAMVSDGNNIGYINVVGNFGYVNSIQGAENIEFKNGETKEISDEEFDNYIKGIFGISLNKTSLSLIEGTSVTLVANVSASNAADKTVTWSSSNSSVATVNSSGTVTAKTAGTATITAITTNGLKATCIVTVSAASISGVSVASKPTKTSYYIGETLKTSGLKLTVSYNNGKTETITSGLTCTPTTLNSSGTQSITVNYRNHSTTFTVSVKKPTVTLSTYSESKSMDCWDSYWSLTRSIPFWELPLPTVSTSPSGGNVSWSIVSGSAYMTSDYIAAQQPGTIVARATYTYCGYSYTADYTVKLSIYKTPSATNNLRSSHSKSSSSLTTVPTGATVWISEVWWNASTKASDGQYYLWGKTTYNGHSGWIVIS